MCFTDMIDGAQSIQKLLAEEATVQIHAYPNFLLEFILSLLLGCIYFYLNLEVTKIYKQTVDLSPHTIHYTNTVKGKSSKESICTTVSHIRQHYKIDWVKKGQPGCTISSKRTKRTTSNGSRIDWLLKQQPADFFEPIFGNKSDRLHVDQLAALTPAQFVKLDKERQLSEKQINGCIHSLTTLLDNIVAKKYSQSVLREQVEKTKEDTFYSRFSDQMVKYRDSESVTESLIDVLNAIVEDATAENPLPAIGELTALIKNIGNHGNMQDKSSMIFDTKCDLIQSSTTESSGTKTDISDREPRSS